MRYPVIEIAQVDWKKIDPIPTIGFFKGSPSRRLVTSSGKISAPFSHRGKNSQAHDKECKAVPRQWLLIFRSIFNLDDKQ